MTSFSRVDSAMRGSSISFLTRARVAWLDSCFGLFLGILARFHESEGITGQFGTEAGSFRIIFIPCSFEQLCQSAKCSISGVHTNGALPPRVGGLDYRRRTVSEGRRRVEGNEVQIFTVSLNGANFICADSESNNHEALLLGRLCAPCRCVRFVFDRGQRSISHSCRSGTRDGPEQDWRLSQISML